MSKATIVIEANENGMFDINVELDPPAEPEMTQADHPAAFAAVSVLSILGAIPPQDDEDGGAEEVTVAV